MNHIYKEFQGKSKWVNEKREHVAPFSNLLSKAPRYFMRNSLHPSDVLSLGEEGLRELSIRENLKLRDKTIKVLIEYAQNSISQPKDFVEANQFLLRLELD